MATHQEQNVIDAAVALSLAEKALFEVTSNHADMFSAQMQMANVAAGGDWLERLASHRSTDRAARIAIAENDVKKAKVALFVAVREYQKAPDTKV